MKKFICLICAAALLTLSGCSGGSIYTNYREVEQLMVIQTLGFDKAEDGITLSVSTGNSGGGTSSGGDGGDSSQSQSGSSKTSRLSVTANTVSLAQEKLRDYSSSEELFFAHTSYIAIGEDSARDSIRPYLMFIARSTSVREGTPIFIIEGSTAEDFILGAGGKDYDATVVLKSLERNIKNRGDCEILPASDITANLNQKNASLVTAIKCVKAKNVVEDAEEDELTAVPAGYAVIKDGRMTGSLDLSAARGVSILQNKLKSCYAEVEVDGKKDALLLENCSCKIKPTVSDGKVTKLDIKIELSSALAEADGQPDLKKLNSALEKKAEQWVRDALDKELEYGCDFLGLGSILERQKPFKLSGLGEDFENSLDGLTYNINVSAELVRSFDIESTEAQE